MDQVASRRIAVAVIGGNGTFVPDVDGAVLHGFSSTRDGGNGRRRSAVVAIRGGGFVLVIVVVRWLAHGDSDSVRAACRRAGIPCRIVAGGMTAVARAVRAFVEGGRDGE